MYKEGDWVWVQYDGQHCFGWDSKYGEKQLFQIVLYNSNNYFNRDGYLTSGYSSSGRWVSFISEDGRRMLFTFDERRVGDYIIEKANLEPNYEIY